MKKISIFLFGFVFLLGFQLQAQNTDQEQLKKLETFMRYVQLAYVDTVDSEKLTEIAIKSVLKELDPHSVYISKKDLNI